MVIQKPDESPTVRPWPVNAFDLFFFLSFIRGCKNIRFDKDACSSPTTSSVAPVQFGAEPSHAGRACRRTGWLDLNPQTELSARSLKGAFDRHAVSSHSQTIRPKAGRPFSVQAIKASDQQECAQVCSR